MNRKLILSVALTLAVLAAIAQKPFAVVELFTSEGCSSCPPAERVLSDLKSTAEKNHQQIYFLEYHVDYWNRLGWKDPYSSFQFTHRQQNYTSVLNEESMYTPMMIVNGTTAFTGSDAVKAKASVAAALTEIQSQSLKIKIDSIASDTIFIHYTTSKADKNFFIRAGVTESGLVSSVGKGENAGKTLAHDSVVRIFFSADAAAASAQLKVPLKNFSPGKKSELIVFIQHKQSMKILAAASAAF